jgi:hypothetical protein
MNFFKTRQRTPTDLARGLRDNILKLESAPPGEPRKKVRAPVRSMPRVALIWAPLPPPLLGQRRG